MFIVSVSLEAIIAVVTREIFFQLEDKLHMFAPPCNILYLFDDSTYF